MIAFQLVPQGELRQKQPRIENKKHLAFIRTLPCIVCGASPSDPAHLKSGNLDYGKESSGTMKPDDRWVNPLCRWDHDSQHGMKELAWWALQNIDPFASSIALFEVSGDYEAAIEIIWLFRERAHP
jgi:hypothetical protein